MVIQEWFGGGVIQLVMEMLDIQAKVHDQKETFTKRSIRNRDDRKSLVCVIIHKKKI